MLWGKTNIPSPKLLTSLPDGSNSRIGATLEPAHVLAPQRSKTQMLPAASRATALVEPHVLFSFAHPFSAVYDVLAPGRPAPRLASFAHPPLTATATATATQTMIVRDIVSMTAPSALWLNDPAMSCHREPGQALIQLSLR